MEFTVNRQESYSRMELLLRTIFGLFYIVLPHMFLLVFVGIWGAILSFIAFWVVLFTGRYPESWFEYQVGLIKWQTRLNLRLFNMADGYPTFGINGSDESFNLNIEYPERLSRGHQLLKLFFGVFYVGVPHGFILAFRMLLAQILLFFGWFAILFTGKFPKSWFNFIVGNLRWSLRVNLYMTYMSDRYPPFSGKTDEELALA